MAGAGFPVKQEALALRGVDALLFSMVSTHPHDQALANSRHLMAVCRMMDSAVARRLNPTIQAQPAAPAR